jgi:O-antigen/teichoic acid export membrane protein
MSSLAKKSFRILLSQGGVGVFSILFTIYFAYEFPKSVFAFVALYETAVSLSRVVCDLGLHFQIIREAPPLLASGRSADAYSIIVLPSTLLRVIVAGLTSIVFYFLVILSSNWLDDQVGDLNFGLIAWMCTVHMFLTGIETITITIFAIRQRFGTDAFLESAAGLIENVFALVCYLMWGTEFYFLGILIGITLMVIIRIYLLRDIFRHVGQIRLSWASAKSTLKTFFPFYIRRFFRIGFVQGEQLLIPLLLPLTQLANFKLAKRCSVFLKNYTQAFSDPLLIKMSRSRNPDDRRSFTTTFMLFTIPLPLFLTCLSPWIMHWIGGAKYSNSWHILAVLYLSYVFYAVSQFQLTIISVFGRPVELLMRDAVAGVIGLLSTFILILLFDEYGIAWGQLVSYAVLCVIGYRVSTKYLNVRKAATETSE